MTNWSRSHFQVIAEVLDTARDAAEIYPDWNSTDTLDHVEDLFVQRMKAANPNFREDQFRKAAKGQ